MLPTIGFIGSGNMARAMITGLCTAGYPTTQLWASAPHEEHLTGLDIQTTTDNLKLIAAVDVVILCVKPQILPTLCPTLVATLADKKPVIISVAAGVRIASLAKLLNYHGPIIRAMPNLPAAVNLGFTGLYQAASDTASQAISTKLFSMLGQITWVAQESDLDKITAITASGPGFMYAWLHSWCQAVEKMGFDPATAKQMVLQTALGASTLGLQFDGPLTELQAQVTSKGGTTAAGLAALSKYPLDALSYDTLRHAWERAQVLAQEVQQQV